ncbi:Uncharacterized protein PCOAH_00047660 [Plasmodium coatneyi]|uniref:KIR protein n=1 Tax=Plasmodium coatneyi TaxID=208452 RepID=A0A1B1E6L6_9APIC|nr:Uncharacterized protein PCOAH_00047660 [Plasmodium coatneyi]ANQ10684.1 Uncharacterized protein PCOAH_00047660 [Plasmodium coatneyi]
MLLGGGEWPEDSSKLATEPLTDISEYSNFSSQLSTIESAWNLVSKIKGQYPDDSTICEFFYHWLGLLLFDKCNLSSISSVIDKIYEQLKTLPGGVKCNCNPLNNQYTNKDNFSKEKTKFDLNQDYNPKNEQLQKYYGLCDSGYKSDPGRNAPPSTVPSDVQKLCGRNGSNPTHPYCTNFKTTYKDYCTQNPSEIECKLINGAGNAIKEKAPLVVSTGGATATPIVSSVIGIGAIPAIVFLLYKVIVQNYIITITVIIITIIIITALNNIITTIIPSLLFSLNNLRSTIFYLLE